MKDNIKYAYEQQKIEDFVKKNCEDCIIGSDDNYDNYIVLDSVESEDLINEFIKRELNESNVLEDYYELVTFSDEVMFCTSCGDLIVMDYSVINYLISHDNIFCISCIEPNLDNILNNFMNDSRKALSSEMVEESILLSHGYTKLEKVYSNGLYDAHDVPNDVLNELNKVFDEVIFYIISHNPFEVSYIAFVR